MNQVDGLPLEGGNSGTEVRPGETVRRPSGPWTPFVQQFISALRDRGSPSFRTLLGWIARVEKLSLFAMKDAK
jgi:hypothetical protein